MEDARIFNKPKQLEKFSKQTSFEEISEMTSEALR